MVNRLELKIIRIEDELYTVCYNIEDHITDMLNDGQFSTADITKMQQYIKEMVELFRELETLRGQS